MRSTIPSSTIARQLDAVLDRLVARRHVDHAVISVERGDGSLRWRGAAGTATPDGVPMRADTPFFVASVTKLFIAAAVLQLHERGQVDLDAPITTYLPGGLTDGLHRLDGVDHTPRIAVRHLLSHTSGLPDYLEDRPRGGRSWYEDLADGADHTWDLPDVIDRARELRPAFAPQDPSAARQRARYSDTGFQLLIAIVEAVSDRSFAAVLAERFFRPLGMLHSYLPGRSAPLEPTPTTAALSAKGRALDLPGVVRSSNDLVSTVDDLQRFHRALVAGEVFDDPRTYRLMHERWNRILFPLRYGLGTMRFRVNRLVAPHHRPVTLVGHSGATGSWLFHCPELDLYLAGTVDQLEGRALPFRVMARLLRAAEAGSR